MKYDIPHVKHLYFFQFLNCGKIYNLPSLPCVQLSVQFGGIKCISIVVQL